MTGRMPVNPTAEAGDDVFLTLNIRLPSGETIAAEAAPDFSVMELIRAYGVRMIAECGGSCVCATCHVHVGEAWVDRVPAPDADELDRLDQITTAADRSRLACQIRMTDELDGLEIQIQPDSLKTPYKTAA